MRVLYICLAAVFLSGGLLFGIQPEGEYGSGSNQKENSILKENKVQEVYEIPRQNVEMEFTFPVVLEPLHRSQIYPEIFTRVIELPKRLGDSFSQGDLLVKFNNEVYKAALFKTEQMVEKTKADLSVKKSLFSDRLITEAELKEANAALAAAHFEYAVAKKNLEESEIIAPYDGKIAELNIHLYEIPVRDKPILEIVDDKTLLASFLIPGNYLAKIDVGVEVYVRINETGEIVKTHIKRISPVINPASDTVRVEAEIDNRKGRLKSGMASLASFSKQALTHKDESLEKLIEQIKKD